MPTTKPVKLVPPNKMFSGEAPLETTSRHQKFKKMLKKVLKTVGDIDLTFDSGTCKFSYNLSLGLYVLINLKGTQNDR